MKLSFDEIVELIHREMYVRNGVMLGEKAAAKAILQAEEAAQQSVQPTLLTLCPECGVEQIVTHLPTCAHYVAQSG